MTDEPRSKPRREPEHVTEAERARRVAADEQGGMVDNPAVVALGPCDRCGRIHRHCKGHVNRVVDWDGIRREPCRKNARQGQLVCHNHGGNQASNLAAAETRRAIAEQERLAAGNLRRRLGLRAGTPVVDPAAQLADLAGEIVAWKDATMAMVAELQEQGSEPEEGEEGASVGSHIVPAALADVHPLIKLAERAQDRAAKVLADMVKLGFVERQVQVEEAQMATLDQALRAVLVQHGLDPGIVLPDLAAELRRQEAIPAMATELGP